MSESENKRERVLLVDDHDGLRSTLALLLNIKGFDVVEASDGDEAVDAYRDSSFLAVVMDVDMPRMSGIEATREILALDPNAKILLSSGDYKNMEGTLEAGARFLPKGADTSARIFEFLEQA